MYKYKILEWDLIFQKKSSSLLSLFRREELELVMKRLEIGLYLFDKIIQKSKGIIDAFSEVKDKGAIFTVKLKIHE